MRAIRGWSASASGGLSAEAGVAVSSGVTFGAESVGGGGVESTGGDGGASSDDGGAIAIIETDEDESVDEDFALRPFLRSACAEEAVRSASTKTMPMNFGDFTMGLSVLEG